MRHRIKKIPNLIHNKLCKSHLLHSDKTTYFYNKGKCLAYPSSMFGIIPLLVPALALLLIIGTLLNPDVSSTSSAYATDEVTEVTDTPASQAELSPSLSLTMPGHEDEETINLQKQVDENTNKGYLAIDFNVIATNIDKYDVYVQSSTSALIGDANGGKIESILSDTDYANLTNSGWGYSVAKGQQDPTTLTYKPIQTTVNTSADTGTAKDTTITQPYTLAFAANLSGATADHYQSDIILSVAAGANQVATLYSVTYNTNGSTSGTTPPTQTAQSDNPTYGFAAPTATQYSLAKGGYIFLGWAESPTATTPQYLPNDAILLTADNPNKNLYAIWKLITPVNSWSELEYMQQMTSAICTSANVDDTKQLIDSRDGKIYWVTKLKDNQCWMTQNLDLDLKNVTLVPSDSNVSSNWVSTTGSSTTDGYSTTDYYLARYYDPGYKYCNTNNCNATTSSNNGHDHQGNLYSWTAATAGTGTGSVTSGVGSSICPKGWQLPTGGSSNTKAKSFGGLTTAYNIGSDSTGSTTVRATPLYFIYSGYIYNFSLSGAGSSGYYWASTTVNSTFADAFSLISSDGNRSSFSNRSMGYAIRCVAQ